MEDIAMWATCQGGTMQMELACCESVILNEIAQGCNQRQIAQTYALAMRSTWPTDWKKVNEAIVNRWSVAGLNRINNMAWRGKCLEEKKS